MSKDQFGIEATPLRRVSGPARVYVFFRRWPILPGSILTLLLICGAFASFVAPSDPTAANLRDRNIPPAWSEGGSSKYLLGADHQGRDVLSRIIFGARTTLIVAGVSLMVGGVVGTVLGMVSGYYGGWVDEIAMRLIDIVLSVPLILVALSVVIVFGQSTTVLIGILAMNAWSGFARQSRAEVLQLKNMDYVALAKVTGASTPRILYKHIFPGVVSTITVVGTLQVGNIILTEAILSFLGAGIPPPAPSWGSMVSDGRTYLGSAWWIALFPGMAIFLTVLAFNFLGDWLRDTLDPRLRQSQ